MCSVVVGAPPTTAEHTPFLHGPACRSAPSSPPWPSPVHATPFRILQKLEMAVGRQLSKWWHMAFYSTIGGHQKWSS